MWRFEQAFWRRIFVGMMCRSVAICFFCILILFRNREENSTNPQTKVRWWRRSQGNMDVKGIKNARGQKQRRSKNNPEQIVGIGLRKKRGNGCESLYSVRWFACSYLRVLVFGAHPAPPTCEPAPSKAEKKDKMLKMLLRKSNWPQNTIYVASSPRKKQLLFARKAAKTALQ